MEQINQSAEMKQERIAQIKAAIEADTYETPEKLEAALGKFLDQYTSEDNS
jgi:anti-sigma28 factor (negative regulator of flagellin synthesis)